MGVRGVRALLVSEVIVSYCFGLDTTMNDLHNSVIQ